MPAAPVILIADADAALRAALAFTFELEGFRVESYADAAALRAATLPARGCLIVDHALSGGHGLALLRELRSRRPDLHAILIATHPRPAVRAAAARAGIPIVEKPLMGNALAECVQSKLGQPAQIA